MIIDTKIKPDTVEIKTSFVESDISISTEFSDVIEVVTSDVPYYEGDYTVIPLAEEEKILETKNKLMSDDVTVKKVPIYSVDNEHGQTVSIGVEV